MEGNRHSAGRESRESEQPASREGNEQGRVLLNDWRQELLDNVYTRNSDFQHSIQYHFGGESSRIHAELERFGHDVPLRLEPLVAENDFRLNLPRLEAFDGIGERIDAVVHHPAYVQAGNIIYGTKMMQTAARAGGLLESLALFFLSCHAGEAGHNCPVACTAGILRVLRKFRDLPNREAYWQKLVDPCFETNFTGAQFVTEIQGGSDVALNAAVAEPADDGSWRVHGEKWFCSNADANLILMTARHDPHIEGTKGLGLYLLPAVLEDGRKNHYTLRRLKEKIGTRTMASAEIDFHGAVAYPVGDLRAGFKNLMENVLHLSRLYNSFAALGLGQRAYQIACSYARNRVAFGHPIIDYPLVKENLAAIKAENTAMLASIMATTHLQDKADLGQLQDSKTPLLLRLLANLNKYLSALWTVEHVHHALDVLAGNGAIESFSSMPRLLRDSIVIENWEGTHNTLRMQILRDLHRYRIGEIYLDYLQDQIDRNCTDEPWNSRLTGRLAALRERLHALADSSEELQRLVIREVVDEMAQLFCALHLYREAVHQEETTGSSSKRRCLNYFNRMHPGMENTSIDRGYLGLLNDLAGC